MRHEARGSGGEQRFLDSLSRPVPDEYREVIGKISLFGTSQRFARSFEMLSFYDHGGLTPRGKQLADRLAGGEIIDLGCGLTHWAESEVAEPAARLGARRYIGVDNDRVDGHEYSLKNAEGKLFEIIFKEDDMLSYVSKIDGPLADGPRVFYLSGLESDPTMDNRYHIVEDYFDKLWREFQRVTKPGDAVIINNCKVSPRALAGENWVDKFLRYGFKFEPADAQEGERVRESGPYFNYNIVFVRI